MGAGALKPEALARGLPKGHVRRQSQPDRKTRTCSGDKPAAHALVNLHHFKDLIFKSCSERYYSFLGRTIQISSSETRLVMGAIYLEIGFVKIDQVLEEA